MLTTLLKSFDTFVTVATTSSSITLFLTGIGFQVIPISTGKACRLITSKKVVYEINMRNFIKYKKQNEKDQQTIKSFDELYKKTLQVNLIDKTGNESLCNTFTEYLDETKNESFSKNLHKKVSFLVIIKIKST